MPLVYLELLAIMLYQQITGLPSSVIPAIYSMLVTGVGGQRDESCLSCVVFFLSSWQAADVHQLPHILDR